MRNTSFRRRSGLRVLGSVTDTGTRGSSAWRAPSLIVPDGTPNSVVCDAPNCGVRVMALVDGQPRAHSAGGYPTSVKRGAYKCEGSGTRLH